MTYFSVTPDSELEHGDPRKYGNYGCRCEVCVPAYRAYTKEGQEKLEEWRRSEAGRQYRVKSPYY